MARGTDPRLTIARRNRVIRDFENRFLRHYVVVQMNRTLLEQVAALCRAHPLRAYDAFQLACALITRRDDDLAAGQPSPIFVCADIILLGVAATEGLPIENPNSHP